jgi:hypothetical protein
MKVFPVRIGTSQCSAGSRKTSNELRSTKQALGRIDTSNPGLIECRGVKTKMVDVANSETLAVLANPASNVFPARRELLDEPAFAAVPGYGVSAGDGATDHLHSFTEIYELSEGEHLGTTAAPFPNDF